MILMLLNIFFILKYNRLWIPFFFIVGLRFMLPTVMFKFLLATPLPTIAAIATAFLLHYLKLKSDDTKITYNYRQFLIINADRRFPIGTLVFMSLVSVLPEIMQKMNDKGSFLTKEQLIENMQSVDHLSAYLILATATYFYILGIFYTYQSLKTPAKK